MLKYNAILTLCAEWVDSSVPCVCTCIRGYYCCICDISIEGVWIRTVILQYIWNAVATTICVLDASISRSLKRIRQIPIISAKVVVFASSLHFTIYQAIFCCWRSVFFLFRFCFYSSSGVSSLLTTLQYSCYNYDKRFCLLLAFGIAYDEGHWRLPIQYNQFTHIHC